MRARLAWLVLLAIGGGCGAVVPEAGPGSTGAATSTSAQGSTTADPPRPDPPQPTSSGVTTTHADNTTEPEDSSSSFGSSIGDPDGGIGGIECSVLEQEYCLGDDVCRAWANDGGDVWNGVRCRPAPSDPIPVGEPCVVEEQPASGLHDCEPFAMCWDIHPVSLEGTCVGFCSGSTNSGGPDLSCEDPDLTCLFANEGVVVVCVPRCDPLGFDCELGQGCYPTHDDDFACVLEGAGVVDTASRSVHKRHAACPTRSFMVDAQRLPDCRDEACCTTFCSLLDPNPCAEGLFCVPFEFDGETPEAHPYLGMCVLPDE